MISDISQCFLPNDEWLYLKIYSGYNTLDRFLYHEMLDFTQTMEKKGWIDNFFYIRYHDPEFHIRLRFHLTKPNSLVNVSREINRIIKPMVDKSIFWNVTVNSYEPEVERYGLYSMGLVEKIFFNDSINCLRVLRAGTPEQRWLFSVEICDFFMNQFNFNNEQKSDFCHQTVESFKQEYSFDKQAKVALDLKYRKYEQQILDRLTLEPSAQLLNYARNIEKTCYELAGLKNFYDKATQGTILSSILHMHFNRLLSIEQRLREFVIYYFLKKAYSSIGARIKKNANLIQ